MGIETGIAGAALLGLAAKIIWDWLSRNGVNKEVCIERHKNIESKLDDLKVGIGEIHGRIDDLVKNK